MIRPQLEEFMRRMAPKSVAIIPGAHDTRRSNDTHYRFRQDSDFFYLTGFDEPDAVAVIKPESDKKYTLFVRPRDPEREIWDGRRAGVEGAISDFGATEAFPIAEFESMLTEFLDGEDAMNVYHVVRVPDDAVELFLDIALEGGSDIDVVAGDVQLHGSLL